MKMENKHFQFFSRKRGWGENFYFPLMFGLRSSRWELAQTQSTRHVHADADRMCTSYFRLLVWGDNNK